MGDLDMPSASARTGNAQALRQAVLQYDPEYTQLLAQQRKEGLKEFMNTSSSKAGGQLISLNTLVHHADLYLDTAAALQNGTFRPGNAVYQAVQDLTGKAQPTNAALVAQFLAGETGKVATGGTPTEGEVNKVLAKLGTSSSPDQIAGAGQTLLQIASGRMIPLKEMRDKAGLQKFVDILGPDARNILIKRGYDPETMQKATGQTPRAPIVVIDPNGGAHPFATEAGAQAFENMVKQSGGTTRRQ